MSAFVSGAVMHQGITGRLDHDDAKALELLARRNHNSTGAELRAPSPPTGSRGNARALPLERERGVTFEERIRLPDGG
jgi:hypothetical protein